ncbi:PRC-barrel domain-containing protein (plasmid) [Lichenicola cladoniae]|uniref:PRC-barrel domain-containing protein n=1 Tax=Lichenicola cladoniae TaxID=1484109 RepID=A0A6M8HYD5_9PROT|nr:PRC-barrel domain-containing protein [Lichenicola cladoniae]NPD70298.1 PRC-barrel domain-containing protein [Acetobacteraceae bacterium]QKE93543.1 PRC-barrel domain-containing protein [Lichenicola cladoniae]
MLNAVSSLKGFEIQAKDGSLGTVSDFLFDDSTWKVLWMVVDTGRWLSGRKVLIHPSAVISAEYGERELKVALTKAQVKDSPDVGTDRPVSRQMQNDLYGYYGSDPLWGGSMFGAGLYGGSMNGFAGGGMGAIASPLSAPAYFGTAAVQEAERGETNHHEGDPHLRSIAEVTGYHVHSTDGDIGHIQDLLIDNASWGIRYLIVDTSNWWVGQHVLISPYAVQGVDWSERHVRLDLTRAKVKSSPSWNPYNVIDGEFEQRLHNHYDWPGYGW